MNRRTLLAALGAVGAGGAIATGTGAFTSVEAERDLTVDVADDSNALLALEPGDGPNGNYADTSNGTLGIDISGEDGDDATSEGATGVNTDAVTLFENVFTIINQGTQPVEVGITPLTFIDVDGFSGLLLVLVVPRNGFPTVTLDVGNEEHYSIVTAAIGGSSSDLGVDSRITVAAEATA